MKPVYEMSGPERAAALMVALGADTASDILKHLDPESIDRITAEMARIGRLSPEDREDLVGEFLVDLKKEKKRIKGGEDTARELLCQAFGKEKAEEVIKKLENIDLEQQFEFLKEADSEIIVALLKDEMPQTIAVTLGYLPPAKSASILKSLPRDTAKAVAIKIARMKKVAPEAAAVMAGALKKRYDEYLKNHQKLVSDDGLKSLLDIMTHMSGAAEKKLLDTLEKTIPEITEEIRGRIFSFDNIVNLTNREVRLLIDYIADDHIIAKALKGAGDQIRFKFLRNMSQNRASEVLRDMDIMGPIRLDEAVEARSRIVAILMKLDEDGKVAVRRGNETFVE